MSTWLYGYNLIPLRVQGAVNNTTVVSGQATIPLFASGSVESVCVSANISIPFTSLIRPATVWPDEGLVSDWEVKVNIYQEAEGFALVLPALKFSGVGVIDNLGAMDLLLPGLVFQSEGVINEAGSLAINLPGLRFSGRGEVGETGSMDISLPKLRVSFGGYEFSNGTLSVVIPAQEISFSGIISETANLAVNIPMFKLVFDSIQIQDCLNMVMNLKNRGFTLYTNYVFNSLCRFNGKHLGMTENRIYDLDSGTTDDGTPIDWNLRTGYLDLHQKIKKKLRQAWFSYKSDGNIIVTTVSPDGTEYEYDLEGIEVTEDGIRVKFGKGLKGKYVALDVKNVDGSSITLDTLKLHFEKIMKER